MTLTFDVEMEFTAGNWTSVYEDVRQDEMSAEWGIKGSNPTDRIADTGTYSFTLENSWANSGGLTGYYSPDNANLRSNFGIGTPVRLKATNGTLTMYKKFYITSINPEPGLFRGNGCMITAEDYIGKMSSQYASKLTVLLAKTVDEALTALVATMPVAPDSTSYSTGLEDLPYVFHDVDGRRTTVMNACQRLLQSDLGYITADMNATNGEKLGYQTRQDRILDASIATLSDSMDELELEHIAGNIYNLTTIIYHPVKVADAVEALYTLQTETEITPGKTVSFTARYRDSEAGAQSIRLLDGSEVTPVADTDYKATTTPGSGNGDANASLSVFVAWYADAAEVALTNIGAATIYTGGDEIFQLRGKGIRLYDTAEAVVEDTSANLEKYGNSPLRFDLPYQNNINTAMDFANFLFNSWHLPKSLVKSSQFLANKASALETAMLSGVIGAKFTHVETVTGINSEFCINGVKWAIEPGGFCRARWYLEKQTGAEFWFLGESGYSELGETTILGF